MAFEQDWVMRQIDMMTEFLARTVLNKALPQNESSYQETAKYSDRLNDRIEILVDQGKICQAEDLLFDELDTDDMKHLLIGVNFYQKINSFSDDELEEMNFSREEVMEGLNEVMDKFGISIAFD